MPVVMRGAEEEGDKEGKTYTHSENNNERAAVRTQASAHGRTDARTHGRTDARTATARYASNMAGRQSEEHDDDEEWWEELPAELNKHNIHSSIPSLCICTYKFDTL